ncbi:MAG: TraB/GumN family protein [Gammaproteobacteria bacterium]
MHILGTHHYLGYKKLPTHIQHRVESLIKRKDVHLYNEINHISKKNNLLLVLDLIGLIKYLMTSSLWNKFYLSNIFRGLIYPWYLDESLSINTRAFIMKFREDSEKKLPFINSFSNFFNIDIFSKDNILDFFFIKNFLPRLVPKSSLQQKILPKIFQNNKDPIDTEIVWKREQQGLKNLTLENQADRDVSDGLFVDQHESQKKEAQIVLAKFDQILDQMLDLTIEYSKKSKELLKEKSECLDLLKKTNKKIFALYNSSSFDSLYNFDESYSSRGHSEDNDPEMIKYFQVLYELMEGKNYSEKEILENITRQDETSMIIRQLIWIPKLLKHLYQEENIFAFFGAAHLSGKFNILELLALHGCKIFHVKDNDKEEDVTESVLKNSPFACLAKNSEVFALPKLYSEPLIYLYKQNRNQSFCSRNHPLPAKIQHTLKLMLCTENSEDKHSEQKTSP